MTSAVLEVTAVNPADGRTKVLNRDELQGLLDLLAGYEEALRHSEHADLAQAAQLNKLGRQFRAMGLDVEWYAKGPRADRELFTARVGLAQKPGYCLKDLLDIAREAGVIPTVQPAAGIPVATLPSAARPADKLVFVVDDDEAIRELVAYTLRKEGFRLDVFEDGVEMLEAVHRTTPDLIVLDLMLPKQGGYEVLRELQAGDAAAIPVVVMTGRNVDPEMSSMLRQEANLREFFQKPVQPKALTTIVHKLLKTEPHVPTRVK